MPNGNFITVTAQIINTFNYTMRLPGDWNDMSHQEREQYIKSNAGPHLAEQAQDAHGEEFDRLKNCDPADLENWGIQSETLKKVVPLNEAVPLADVFLGAAGIYEKKPPMDEI